MHERESLELLYSIWPLPHMVVIRAVTINRPCDVFSDYLLVSCIIGRKCWTHIGEISSASVQLMAQLQHTIATCYVCVQIVCAIVA